MVTVAPGAVLVPIRALNNEGTGTDLTVALAIQTAIDADVDVINLSLRLEEDAEVVEECLQMAWAAGIKIFAGAGNDSPGKAAVYPASSIYTVAVAATEASGSTCQTLADFSAYGGNVEFACVGVDVANSVPGKQIGDAWVKHATGTSISCAVASATYALVRDYLPPPPIPSPYTPMQYLQATALPVDPAGAVVYGLMAPFHDPQ
jgi:subtilisin family serine protease